MTARKKRSLVSIVGANISRRRKELGLTQAEVAEKLDMGGDSLSRIENGVVAPRFQRLEEMAVVLDCAVVDFFRRAGDPLWVKLSPVEDLLRSLPPEAQDGAVCLIKDMAELIKKYYNSH